MGVESPADLPRSLRTKQHTFDRRKSSEPCTVTNNKLAPILKPAVVRSRSPSSLGGQPPRSGSVTSLTPMTMPDAHHRYQMHPHHGPTESSPFIYDARPYHLATSPGGPGGYTSHGSHGSPAFAEIGNSNYMSRSSSPSRFGPHDSSHALPSNLDPALFRGTTFGVADDDDNDDDNEDDGGVVGNGGGAAFDVAGSSMEQQQMGQSHAANLDSMFASLTNQDAEAVESSSAEQEVVV